MTPTGSWPRTRAPRASRSWWRTTARSRKHPEVLVTILKAAGVGSLPDFGNFPDEETRERGLRALFPLAGALAHAKLREGQDFGRCLRIAKESGFTGVFSIEAGGKEDPYVEVQKIADALVDNL